MVLYEDGHLITLDGNRRLAALRHLKKDMKISCHVYKNREEAKDHLLSKHGGEQEGAGQIPWPALCKADFEDRDALIKALVNYGKQKGDYENTFSIIKRFRAQLKKTPKD